MVFWIFAVAIKGPQGLTKGCLVVEKVWIVSDIRKLDFDHPLPQSHGVKVVHMPQRLQPIGDRSM